MHKLRVVCEWGFQIDVDVDKPTDLYVDIVGAERQSNSLKILLLFEPDEIKNLTNTVIRNHKNFDYILTHDERIINNCDNAMLFEFGSTWISDYTYSDKKFEVSTLVGFKEKTHGHRLRHQLWLNQDKITAPKKFFLSRHSNGLKNFGDNPVLGEKKDPLFDSQFHIVIENVSRKYWFTEKLMDTIKTKTVPIYLGCPNIDKYFNTEGMIIVNSVEEIINVCNNLTESDYTKRIPILEENHERGREFENLQERVKNKIRELVNNE